MPNIYVYDAIAIVAGISPNRRMQVTNSCSSPFVKCMNLHWNICSGNVRLTKYWSI